MKRKLSHKELERREEETGIDYDHDNERGESAGHKAKVEKARKKFQEWLAEAHPDYSAELDENFGRKMLAGALSGAVTIGALCTSTGCNERGETVISQSSGQMIYKSNVILIDSDNINLLGNKELNVVPPEAREEFRKVAEKQFRAAYPQVKVKSFNIDEITLEQKDFHPAPRMDPISPHTVHPIFKFQGTFRVELVP